jgi:hypothetical protein
MESSQIFCVVCWSGFAPGRQEDKRIVVAAPQCRFFVIEPFNKAFQASTVFFGLTLSQGVTPISVKLYLHACET